MTPLFRGRIIFASLLLVSAFFVHSADPAPNDSISSLPYQVRRNNAGAIEKLSFRQPTAAVRLWPDFQGRIIPELNARPASDADIWSDSIWFGYNSAVPGDRIEFDLARVNDPKALVFLDLGRPDFIDFSHAQLPQLRVLILNGNRLRGFDRAVFPQLKTLVLAGSFPDDKDYTAPPTVANSRLALSAERFPNLKKLHIQGMYTVDMDYESLKGLALEEFMLYGYDGDNLDFISGMPLRKLCIDKSSDIKNLDILGTLSLESLYLDYLPDVNDYSFLKHLKLRELTLTCPRNGSFSLDWLRGMPLEKLTILGNATEIASLAPLQGLPLKELVLSRVVVEDLEPLAALPLERLALDEMRLRSPAGNLDFLAQLKHLKQLYLGHVYYRDQLVNERFDWNQLSGLPIQTLSLYLNTDTSKINVDVDLPALEYLRLSIPQGINPDWKLFRGKRLKVLSVSDSTPVDELCKQASIVADQTFSIPKGKTHFQP